MSFSTSNSKSYIIAVLLSAVALFAGFLAASYLIVAYQVEPVDHRLMKLELQRNSAGKNAVFGDSELNYGFAASGDFVNLSFDGDSITDIVAKVDRFLAAGRPMRIVLQASPHMFAEYRVRQVEQPFFQDYSHGVLSEYHRVRLLRYWGMLLSGSDFAPETQLQPTGWSKDPHDWSTEPRASRLHEARVRVRLHRPAVDFAQQPVARSYENLVARLSAAGITTCLVRPPVSYEYLTFARREPLFAAVDHFFVNLARRYGARYVDLSGVLAGEKQTALFTDPDHLNAVGAPLATQMIHEQCFSRHNQTYTQSLQRRRLRDSSRDRTPLSCCFLS